jgi:hypothetical protein
VESNKVKLPKEVAEAIDYAREGMNWSHANILVRSVRGDWESSEMQPLRDFCRTDNFYLILAQALVNGYEVEQTPEDKVREYYESLKSEEGKDWTASNYQKACATVDILNLLNIKIKGVNDHE